MEEDDPRFSHVDLGSLLEDLSNYAKRLFSQRKCVGEETILPGTGNSPDDLVHTALTDFIIKKRDWRPSSPETAQTEVFLMVRTRVKNRFIDLVRGPSFKKTEIIGANKDQAREDSVSAYEPPDEDEFLFDLPEVMDDEKIIRRAYLAVEGEPELEDYLDAIFCEGITKRSKVAEHLEMDLQEAIRRQGRLRTRLLPLMRALGLGKAFKSHKA